MFRQFVEKAARSGARAARNGAQATRPDRSAAVIALLSNASDKTKFRTQARTLPNQKSNQDFFAHGEADFRSASRPKDYKAILSKLFKDLSLSLAKDKKFEKSGATCTVAVIDGKNVAVASFGDSPAFMILVDKTDKKISLKLTEEHSFKDSEIAKHFATTLDGRFQGLSVPCFGHNFDERISKIQPRIRLFNVEEIAAANGLDLERLHVIVTSDGALEMDTSTMGFTPITTDFQVLDGKNSKLKFEHMATGAGTINNTSEDDMAQSLAEGAIAAGSRDNITVVAATFGKKDLEKNEATTLIVADGNGVNGAEAAQKITMEACAALGVKEPILPKDLSANPSSSPRESSGGPADTNGQDLGRN